MKDWIFYNDNDDNDELNDDNSEEHNLSVWRGTICIESISNPKILNLIGKLVQTTIDNFKQRYLSSEKDVEYIYNNVSRIELYNYINDELQHLLESKTFCPIKKSKISLHDLDNIFLTIVEAIEFLLFDDSDIDDDEYQEDND